MKTVCIIQARMGSKRFPGKVLMDLAGRPQLAQQIDRLKQSKTIDEIVIATTPNTADQPIVQLARQEDIGWFCGSEEDVLTRFIGAAKQFNADVVVRTTADCPLIDPQITDQVIGELVDHVPECDYASNVLERTYPRGLDVEALFLDVLLRIDRLAQSPEAREHVTIVPRAECPEKFYLRSIRDIHDNSDLRWTIDTRTDLHMIRRLCECLHCELPQATYADLLACARAHPELTLMNQHIHTWSPRELAI